MGRPRSITLPIDEVRQMTEEGFRLKAIAAHFGCSRQTVLDRMNEAGIPAHPRHSCPGSLNGAWKGGKYEDADGYILVFSPDHPYATKARRVREHRLVAESILGRYLSPEEVVDHIDGNTRNNNPDNLRVFARNSEHLAVTLKGKIPKWTKDGKSRILAAIRRPRKKTKLMTAAP